jgi:hypothetical protein
MNAQSNPSNHHPTGHIHLDVLGGIAGDMFIATILDARPDLTAGTVDAIRAAGLPEGWVVAPENARDGGLVGTRMKIQPPTAALTQPASTGHGQHYHYGALITSLNEARLEPPVRARALDILRLIAEAEAEVHGVEIDRVALHEVGAMDSIADVVGAAHLIEALSPCSWSISPLPVGGGFIQTAHGRLPVPAPATQLLLEGFPFIDDGIDGERITPTGAVILRYLKPSLRMPPGTFEATGTGHGFGTRSLPGLANMLRARCYQPGGVAANTQVAVFEFLIDDQTPEDLASGISALRKRPGVLEVLEIPAACKKGRMGHVVQVLASPDYREQTARACFEETSTIGLRHRLEDRIVLPRREQTGPDGIAVKIVERPGGSVTAKAAMEDIGTHADGHDERQRLRHSTEAAVLSEDDDERR